LHELGFEVSLDPERAEMTVTGLGGRIPAQKAELFIGNAGTAARFLTAFLTLGHGEYILDGDERMRQRPIGDLVAALQQLGANISSRHSSLINRQSLSIHHSSFRLPLFINASGLPGGQAAVSGNISSQFLSGLLMVAPYTRKLVELTVTTELNSKPYVDMTLAVMADFGVEVARRGYERFSVSPAKYLPKEVYAIEPDASAASYFFASPAILGGTVRVEGLTRRSKQGDIAFLDVLQQMGCIVEEGADYLEVTGPASLRGVEVDMRDISDTAQTLAAIAPFASSPTRIRGVGFIRAKETDRIGAMCAELTRLGVEAQDGPDGLTIQPCASMRPACIRTYNDHRMAMAFALIGLRVAGLSIENPACVSKTFPGYFAVLESLR